jgi:hypothetical protein
MNSLRPHVIVNLDKPRQMAFTLNAIADVEEVLDPLPVISSESADNLFRRMKEGKAGVRITRALLWAGLRTSDPDLTLTQAGALMTLNNMAEIGDGIQKALTLFFRQQGIEIEEPAAAPLPISGSGSGASAGNPSD